MESTAFICNLQHFSIYSAGYLKNFYETLINREDSGVQSVIKLSLNTLVQNLQNSEVSQWTYASVIRALIAPIVFLGIFFRNRKILFEEFSVSFPSIFLSIIGTYGWFWVLTPFKYIRQSTHFVLIVIFTSLYIILFSKKIDELNRLLLSANISLFLSEIRLILIFNIVIFLYYFLSEKYKKIINIEFILIIFFVLNLVNMNIEVQEKNKSETDISTTALTIALEKLMN